MFAKTGIAGHVVSISNLEFSAPQGCDVAIALASPGAKAHVSPTQNRGGALSLGYPRASWDSSAHPLLLSIHPPQNP
ncbi:hypothetical protein N656DRAFT_785813 [Canariomyces notabilis]|uniref:Uncharacterized protein n=1 Tax=Canariomyces notabilis TaxID=2074819 RepID=A0AAN6T7K0_9PEZI|nr:hypothetical protein N656DRAFT_785813 [Canariomyces arenarius]